jgi:hypothetical protein
VLLNSVLDNILETLASPDVLDKIVPVLAEKIGEALTPIIEDETKKYIETHVAPLKEAIDNQQKPLIQIKRKYVNSISGLIDLTNK